VLSSGAFGSFLLDVPDLGVPGVPSSFASTSTTSTSIGVAVGFLARLPGGNLGVDPILSSDSTWNSDLRRP